MRKSAIISACEQFRYMLVREWDASLPALGFVMLNPSTADADLDDPTIRKCIGFSKRLGYGSIVVNNLFSYRATDPRDLKHAGYPIGDLTNMHIQAMNSSCAKVVCAWGVNARGLNRASEVLGLIYKPYALRITSDGIPWHPLMLPYSCQLELLRNECLACNGLGYTVNQRTISTHGCCGNPLRTGECCGDAIPVPELVQEQEPCQCQFNQVKSEQSNEPTKI